MTATATHEPKVASAGDWRRDRCLHVIDLESLASGGYAPASAAHGRNWPPDESLRLALAAYRSAIGIQPGDHAMFGLRADRCGRLSDLLASSGTQLRVARDADGVPAALTDSIDIAHAARRFGWLVIAGGHEGFAGLASAARESGMRIWLVGGTGPSAPVIAAMRSRGPRQLPLRSSA